jgi:hypothetical protein
MGRRFADLDPLYSPSSDTRIIRHIVWNGRSDVHEGECQACFIADLDIAMPTAENACGPLCGGTREHLTRYAAWREEDAPRSLAQAVRYVSGWPARPTRFFWSGQVGRHALNGVGPNDYLNDVSGRNALYTVWRDVPGYELHQSYDWEADKAVKPYNWTILEKMSQSTFCFSPLGHRGGDMDRYLPAILTGCIPVFFRYVYQGGRRQIIHPPYEAIINWDQLAVIIAPEDVQNLDNILDAVHVTKKRAHAWSVWRSLLFSSFYGPYLGEGTEEDALHALYLTLDVLRLRDENARHRRALL